MSWFNMVPPGPYVKDEEAGTGDKKERRQRWRERETDKPPPFFFCTHTGLQVLKDAGI